MSLVTKSIDFVQLSKNRGLSIPILEKIYAMFMQSTPIILEELKFAIEKDLMSEIELHAHSIKGSASNFELIRIIDLCKELEDAAKSEDRDFDYLKGYRLLEECILGLPKS